MSRFKSGSFIQSFRTALFVSLVFILKKKTKYPSTPMRSFIIFSLLFLFLAGSSLSLKDKLQEDKDVSHPVPTSAPSSRWMGNRIERMFNSIFGWDPHSWDLLS